MHHHRMVAPPDWDDYVPENNLHSREVIILQISPSDFNRMVLRQRKSAEHVAPRLYVLCARVFRVLMRCFERSHAFRLPTAILRDRLRCRRHTMTREIAVFRVLTGYFTISMRRRARFRASLLFTLNWKGTSAYTFLCPVAACGRCRIGGRCGS